MEGRSQLPEARLAATEPNSAYNVRAAQLMTTVSRMVVRRKEALLYSGLANESRKTATEESRDA